MDGSSEPDEGATSFSVHLFDVRGAFAALALVRSCHSFSFSIYLFIFFYFFFYIGWGDKYDYLLLGGSDLSNESLSIILIHPLCFVSRSQITR